MTCPRRSTRGRSPRTRGWPRRFSGQGEIHAYLRATADRLGLLSRVRFGAEVSEAAWDEEDQEWTVRCTDGSVHRARVLVPAVGQLSRPALPALPGVETFAGPSFHSASWDHEVDLRGRRVAVVGTGASAIQFVPAIAEEVAGLEVFQRTPPYVLPKADRAYTRLHQRLYRRLPAAQRASRSGIFWATEELNKAMTRGGWRRRLLRWAWQRKLRATVPDPELRRALTPDYPLGCRRMLISNDWYPTLMRDHVRLETSPVTRVEPEGLRTADGRLHRADVLIWGTGFAATDFLVPMRIVGRGGAVLQQRWGAGAGAYLGMTVPDFPNLFVIYGPNTNLGGSSIIGMLEAQARYVVQAVGLLAAGAGSLTVRAAAYDAFDAEMQSRLRDSVWSACRSWYRTASGRITANWPGLVAEYTNRVARLDPADYEVTAPGGATGLSGRAAP